ncbi:MAG: HD domain-containing protein [Rhodospirillaceae bacterium]|jgi:predicted HD phosphohydrolase|nr:HD domain-containing protein [Rhodospirillaceae bacterium]MBT6118787.1 HD domain-containing protein [Rhodospirillaceae bacterium]
MPDDLTQRTVSYISMETATKEDYMLLKELHAPFIAGFPDRALKYLDVLHQGFPGELVDRYEHSLQSATRAHRDGADEELVVAALFHDIGDQLAPENHAEFAACVLKPYVTPLTHWIIEKHGLFQGYYYFHHYGTDRNARDEFKGHPGYRPCIDFCHKYDQTSFDPDYDTMPLEAFEPMVHRILGRTPWGDHTNAAMA